jgi:hypothetical protein
MPAEIPPDRPRLSSVAGVSLGPSPASEVSQTQRNDKRKLEAQDSFRVLGQAWDLRLFRFDLDIITNHPM